MWRILCNFFLGKSKEQIRREYNIIIIHYIIIQYNVLIQPYYPNVLL